MMMSKLPKIAFGVGLGACLLMSSPAQASGILLLSNQIVSVIQMIAASQNTCVYFTYDANGNRLTQTTSAVGNTAPVWGSNAYPCFVWGTP